MTPKDLNDDAQVSVDGPEPDEFELLAAFDRMRPQGSLRWGFDDAMRRLSERGAHSGADAIPWEGLPDDLWQRGRSARLGQRLVGDVAGVLASILAADARKAADGAMDNRLIATSDALRYLAARVESLESQVDPAADYLAASREMTPVPDVSVWAETLADWYPLPAKSGPVIVGESGAGVLLGAMERAGTEVRGVEPRGWEVWQTYGEHRSESGAVLGDVAAFLASAEDNSASGVVLVGAIDRLNLAGKLVLLGNAIRVVGPEGTVALLVTDQSTWDESLATVARDLAPGRPLHPETWLFLLRRFGVEDPKWHRSPDGAMHAVVGAVGR